MDMNKTPRRRLTRAIALALLALLVLGACGGGASTGADAGDRPDAHDAVRFVPPENRGAAPTELLARSLSYPGMRGVVEGVVSGDGRMEEVPKNHRTTLITVFEFEVIATHGAPAPLYPPGQTIQLIVGGGELDGRRVEWDGTPEVSAGEHLLVWVGDEGDTPAGQTTDARLVVLSADSVARVVGATVEWSGAQIPVSEVLRLLSENPAQPILGTSDTP